MADNVKPKNKERIQDQRWYYGLCTREMVSKLLKHKGDYLVRATVHSGVYYLVLNTKSREQVDQFKISLDTNDKYYLNAAEIQYREGKRKTPAPTFSTGLELVDFYTLHPLPNNLRLKKPIHRPCWLISPDYIKYTENDLMGSGNFSKVYRGTVFQHKKTNECAIKVLTFKSKEKEENTRAAFLDEAKLHSSYVHENIVEMLGVMVDRPPIMMVLEFCCGGSLDKHLQKFGPRILPYEKQVYLLEAARGMRYLHTNNCVHRDLAARNCLISVQGKVKIADFGLSRYTKGGDALEIDNDKQDIPIPWMAPETLAKIGVYSPCSDVWSYGGLLYEIFGNGDKPFTDVSAKTTVRRIRKGPMPSPPPDTPKEYQELLKEIWRKDMKERITMVQIMSRICDTLAKEEVIAPEHFIVNELRGVFRTEPPNLDKGDDSRCKQEEESSSPRKTNKTKKNRLISKEEISNGTKAQLMKKLKKKEQEKDKRKQVKKKESNTSVSRHTPSKVASFNSTTTGPGKSSKSPKKSSVSKTPENS